MAPGVVSVDIVVIILPVLRAGVVGRVDVDAIDLSGVKILQKLKRVVIVGLDERMPEIAATMLNLVHLLKIRKDRLSEKRDRNQFIDGKLKLDAPILIDAKSTSVLDGFDTIQRAAILLLRGDEHARLHWESIQRRRLGEVFFVDKAKLLILGRLGKGVLQQATKPLVRHLANQIIKCCHISFLPRPNLLRFFRYSSSTTFASSRSIRLASSISPCSIAYANRPSSLWILPSRISRCSRFMVRLPSPLRPSRREGRRFVDLTTYDRGIAITGNSPLPNTGSPSSHRRLSYASYLLAEIISK